MDGITAATAVGWVVSPIIKSVIEKIHNYVENKYFKEAGIEDGMKKLEMSLIEILSVMGTVEKQRILDPNQAQLVRKVKDAIYDAEDVLDEFEYDLLEKKSQKQQRNMVSHVASSSSHSIYQFFVGDDKLKKKVKEVNESLDRARVSAQTLLNLMNVMISSQNMHTDEYENWCITSSLIDDEFVGREKECAALIDLLLRQNDVAESVPIIPIVGQPGIGKTTLAQKVYNDQKLDDHFDQKMWLTVSDNFDKVRLTKEILKTVSPNFSTENANFDYLQTNLVQELASKRVLLVFDDVWYNGDDTEHYGYEREWRQVLASLRKAEQGSKIILTTRFPIVGRILCRPVTPLSLFHLDGLCEEDSWSLFKLCAFDYGNQHNFQELESTGKEIVNKLKGSALAIRVVGGQLRGNSDTVAWKRILDNNPLDTVNIMHYLYRSYEHLPGHLQRCFAFCSLFPKDYLLKPRWLVPMWIGEGFVLPREGKSPEEIGRDYFYGLVSRSFIQIIKRGKKDYYVMHDLMNDLACRISKDECYVLNRGDRLKNLGPIRHLSVTHGFQRIAHMRGLDKLRTLIFLGKHSDDADLSEVLTKLKRIRVLHIGRAGIKSLQKIGECKHLRSLRFGSYDKKIALECFSKLHYLAALLIKIESHNLQNDKEYFSLSQILCKLSTLVLMDTSKPFIVDVGGLTPDLINVWRGGSVYLRVEKKKQHGLDQLGDINNIKGSLRICCLENVTSREEAVKAQLHRKQVKELSLEWSGFSGEVDKKYHEDEVLEALKPNSSIRSLYIYGYPATVCPSWLESNWLSGIESIKLCNCSGIEILPALGQLPLLWELWFESMIAVRRIGHEFYGNGTFPSLKELVFNELWIFADWFRPCDDELFPKLQTLRIMNCPNFTESIWDGFPALKSLQICSSDAMIMKEPNNGYGCLLTIIKLEIINCATIVTWESCYELVSLKTLQIKNCPNLLSIPEMEYFYSLRYLSISDCPKVKSLPKKGLPVSLQLLCIGGTHLLEEQIRRKKGTEWNKVAAISRCVCFISKGKGWKRVKEIDRNFGTILCFNNGGPASSTHQIKKVVIKIGAYCEKDRTRVLKSVLSLLEGRFSVSLDPDNFEGLFSVSLDSDKLIMVGSLDPIEVISCLRKGIYAELLSVGPGQDVWEHGR